MQEVWKDVVGYEGLYQVSNLGRVKSLPKTWIGAKGCIRKHDGIFLSVTKSTKGYKRVNLNHKGVQKVREIHQLVAEAFLGHVPCGYKLIVDHIDNNKDNNCVDNLQLITQRENASKNASKPLHKKTSKYVGVYYDKSKKKFVSRIKINEKNFFIGYFKCELKAHLAYLQKLKEITNG